MKNFTQGFIISNFLLVRTPDSHRFTKAVKTLIQPEVLHNLSFFQFFVHKFEIHIIPKILRST